MATVGTEWVKNGSVMYIFWASFAAVGALCNLLLGVHLLFIMFRPLPVWNNP